MRWIDQVVDENGNLNMIMPKVLWDALRVVANDPAAIGVAGSFVMVKFIREGDAFIADIPSGLNPPCPP